MIGSKRKARLIFTQFIEENIAREEEVAKVACPVGLAIQAQSVPEIAVSIVAQLIQKRAEKKPGEVTLARNQAGLVCSS
jgi:xanthine dehydrogenase accessory factor